MAHHLCDLCLSAIVAIFTQYTANIICASARVRPNRARPASSHVFATLRSGPGRCTERRTTTIEKDAVVTRTGSRSHADLRSTYTGSTASRVLRKVLGSRSVTDRDKMTALLNELRLVLLLVAVWTTEIACKRLNVSPIIGQIAAGLVVGPALLDLIPYVEAFRLLGKLGVMMLVVESGLTVDLDEVRRFGLRASLAAATGVVIPTLLSFVLYSGVLGTGWKISLAVGAAISPTSLGFSAQMLGEVGELTSPIGQLICTAAVIDDVLSLLLLAEVQVLGEDDPKWYAYALPVVASVGSVLVGSLVTIFISSRTRPLNAWLASLNHSPTPTDEAAAAAAVKARETMECGLVTRSSGSGGTGNTEVHDVPQGCTSHSRRAEDRNRNGAQAALSDGGMRSQVGGAISRGDRVLLAIVLALSLLFAYLSASVGSSDLLGCFLGGLAFSTVPGVRPVWARQMKRYTQWGARLFFAATVAFSVPSIYADGGLLRPKPFWKGLILTAAAVIGKLVVGLYAGPPLTFADFSKLGWAMNGRGEFSFFIAQEASDEGVLTAEDYSAVVWALLWSSIAAPIAFRRALAADRRSATTTTSSL